MSSTKEIPLLFLSQFELIFFSYLIVLVTTCSTMLNRHGESGSILVLICTFSSAFSWFPQKGCMGCRILECLNKITSEEGSNLTFTAQQFPSYMLNNSFISIFNSFLMPSFFISISQWWASVLVWFFSSLWENVFFSKQEIHVLWS